MTRELKKAINRIRKAQDASFNGKTSCTAMTILFSSLNRPDEPLCWFSIFCHCGDEVKSFTIGTSSTHEDIDGALNGISDFIGYPV